MQATVGVDELITAARRTTGLDDFGGDSFREGLEVLWASLDREASLNELGAIALREQIVTALSNRLRVTDWITNHPEVGARSIERPIFVLGLPRTGTTLLSYLLDQDPATRSLMRWEAQQCIPPPEAATFTSDPRIEETREAQMMLDTLNPAFKAVHYEAPDGPTECVTLFAQDCKSILWETVANVPSYGEWVSSCDYTSAYEYHRRVLQVLQSRAPGRWSLKSPAHSLALDALLTTYPDARLVMTHRDPVTVVASTCSLVTSLSGTFSDADHSDYIRTHWTELLANLVDRLDRFRSSDDGTGVVDVAYADLVRDPIETVREVYERMGDELTPEAERAMTAYMAANRQGTHGTHAYRLRDLGLDRDALEARFADYRARYDIPFEPVD